MSERYENFIPRKVYRCPCLMHIVNEICDANIRSYSLILKTISKSCITPEQVFSLHVESKTSCMLMCQGHLILTLLSETEYECTSQSDNVFLVVSLQKRYCKSCIRHYFQNFRVCDCFLDIVCFCLNINTDFAQFRKYCVELKRWNDIFIIKNTSRTSGVSLFHEN